MDGETLQLVRSLHDYMSKVAKSLPIPKFLTRGVASVAKPKTIGRVLPPTRAGQRLASGAPALPSHMTRAKKLMEDPSFRRAAEAATGGEIRDPTAMLAMGLRGAGGDTTGALTAMNRIAMIPKQTVSQAGSSTMQAAESQMAQRAAKLRAARQAQLAAGA